jgi:hypothetical protein
MLLEQLFSLHRYLYSLFLVLRIEGMSCHRKRNNVVDCIVMSWKGRIPSKTVPTGEKRVWEIDLHWMTAWREREWPGLPFVTKLLANSSPFVIQSERCLVLVSFDSTSAVIFHPCSLCLISVAKDLRWEGSFFSHEQSPFSYKVFSIILWTTVLHEEWGEEWVLSCTASSKRKVPTLELFRCRQTIFCRQSHSLIMKGCLRAYRW